MSSYPTLVPSATLRGHTESVSQMAGPVVSTSARDPTALTIPWTDPASVIAQNSMIVTGAGDETVRFWNCFPPSGRAPFASRKMLASGAKVHRARHRPAGVLDVLSVR